MSPGEPVLRVSKDVVGGTHWRVGLGWAPAVFSRGGTLQTEDAFSLRLAVAGRLVVSPSGDYVQSWRQVRVTQNVTTVAKRRIISAYELKVRTSSLTENVTGVVVRERLLVHQALPAWVRESGANRPLVSLPRRGGYIERCLSVSTGAALE